MSDTGTIDIRQGFDGSMEFNASLDPHAIMGQASNSFRIYFQKLSLGSFTTEKPLEVFDGDSTESAKAGFIISDLNFSTGAALNKSFHASGIISATDGESLYNKSLTKEFAAPVQGKFEESNEHQIHNVSGAGDSENNSWWQAMEPKSTFTFIMEPHTLKVEQMPGTNGSRYYYVSFVFYPTSDGTSSSDISFERTKNNKSVATFGQKE